MHILYKVIYMINADMQQKSRKIRTSKQDQLLAEAEKQVIKMITCLTFYIGRYSEKKIYHGLLISKIPIFIN